jgi:multiple sugar transport system permease protein
VRPGAGSGWRVSRALRLARRVALYATLSLVTGAVLFPAYWMVVTSIRPARDTIAYPPPLLPRDVRWSAYVELFQTIPLVTWMSNTLVVSAGVTLVCLVLSVLGAFALSHFRWRGRGLFGFLLLVTQMLPEALLVIPIFIIFRRAGLIDTRLGLVLADAAFVVPVAVWVLKAFMDTIPREVREAAAIDGCSPMGILWRITLPLSTPALITVSVIAFFDGWNEYLFASTFVTTSELRPAAVGLASFIGELATPVELVFAATAVFTMVPLGFYFAMQRYFVSGLTSGFRSLQTAMRENPEGFFRPVFCMSQLTT